MDQSDRAVISTADDAVNAKLSCVEKGYYEDPFIRSMAKGVKGASSSHGGVTERNCSSFMEPIIRKGTHARVCAVDKAVGAFLKLRFGDDTSGVKDRRQVVILGAGRDTSYLRHRFRYLEGFEENRVDWFEVDHSFVIQQKAHIWLRNCAPAGYSYKSEMNASTGISYRASFSRQHESDADDSTYHLIGHDLRSSPSSLFEVLCDPFHGFERSIPTIYVLECVIMYLPYDISCNLFRHLAGNGVEIGSNDQMDTFATIAIYDPMPNHDRFGQVMLDNLQKRGIIGKGHKDGEDQQQLSLEITRTLSDQLEKLTKSGFDIAVGCHMMDAYDHGIVSIDERRRAARCEMLDELEEFVLLMRHYCLCVGVHCSGAQYQAAAEYLCSKSIGFKEGKCTVAHNVMQTHPCHNSTS